MWPLGPSDTNTNSTAPRRAEKPWERRTEPRFAYVFGVMLGPTYKDADRAASAAIEEYWTNFAKTGTPGGAQAGLPQWPKFDSSASAAILSSPITAQSRAAASRRPFCDLYVDNVKRLGAR